MTKNMAVKFVDRLFIVVFGTNDPSYQEWLEYLTIVEYHGYDATMQLVFTDGGGPDYFQRRYLAEVTRDYTLSVAVVSSSVRVRALVTAMSWFNSRIRAFPESDQSLPQSEQGLSLALAHLVIPASRYDDIANMRRLLRSQITEADPRDNKGSQTL